MSAIGDILAMLISDGVIANCGACGARSQDCRVKCQQWIIKGVFNLFYMRLSLQNLHVLQNNIMIILIYIRLI